MATSKKGTSSRSNGGARTPARSGTRSAAAKTQPKSGVLDERSRREICGCPGGASGRRHAHRRLESVHRHRHRRGCHRPQARIRDRRVPDTGVLAALGSQLLRPSRDSRMAHGSRSRSRGPLGNLDCGPDEPGLRLLCQPGGPRHARRLHGCFGGVGALHARRRNHQLRRASGPDARRIHRHRVVDHRCR